MESTPRRCTGGRQEIYPEVLGRLSITLCFPQKPLMCPRRRLRLRVEACRSCECQGGQDRTVRRVPHSPWEPVTLPGPPAPSPTERKSENDLNPMSIRRHFRPRPRVCIVLVLGSFLMASGAAAQVGTSGLFARSDTVISTNTSPSPRSSHVEDATSSQSLNPYGSLEAHVYQGEDLGLRSPLVGREKVDPSVDLNRGQKLFWGAVGLVVNHVCEPRTDEFSPVTDRHHEHRTYDEARCTNCDRIERRALGALFDGLLSRD